MNAGFLADVALARRQLAYYEAIHSAVYPMPSWKQWLKWSFFWVLPPLAALFAVVGGDYDIHRWMVANGIPPLPPLFPGIGLAYLLCAPLMYWGTLPTLRLNTFEALRAPSRQALCVARLTRVLPWLLWLGLSLALSSEWIGALSKEPWLSVARLGIVALLPVFILGVFESVLALLCARPRIVLVTYCIAVVLSFSLRWVPARNLDWDTVLLVGSIALAGITIGLFTLLVWAVGRMEPISQLQLARMSIQVPQGRRKVAGRPAARTKQLHSTSGRVGPSPLLRGHGLGPAAVYWALAHIRWNLVIALLWIPVGMFVLPLSIFNPPDHMGINYCSMLLLFFSLFSDPVLALKDPRRLYLLGIDYRTQLLHRIRIFWVTPATLITPVLMVVVALFGPGWETPSAICVAVLGLAAFREGWLVWPGWRACGPRRMRLWYLAVFVLFVTIAEGIFANTVGQSLFGLGAAGRILMIASVAAVLGACGMIAKLRWLDEATLRRETGASSHTANLWMR